MAPRWATACNCPTVQQRFQRCTADQDKKR
jgi:hypothetical protein